MERYDSYKDSGVEWIGRFRRIGKSGKNLVINDIK